MAPTPGGVLHTVPEVEYNQYSTGNLVILKDVPRPVASLVAKKKTAKK
jgi:hypothetical protein